MLIVVAFFAVALWPLQYLTGKTATPGNDLVKPATAANDSSEELTLRIMSSHPLKALSLKHLDKPLLTIEEPDTELGIEHTITGMKIAGGEIEFWVEVALKSTPGENQSPVIHLELVPGNLQKKPQAVTFWGQSGESRIETPAVFYLPADFD